MCTCFESALVASEAGSKADALPVLCLLKVLSNSSFFCRL